jgi:retinol dehydrogenase 12
MTDLAGRTFLVTGGNAGIGFATAASLAKRGGRVYIACRSQAKGEAAVTAIRAQAATDHVHLLHLDLADLASVRQCAQDFTARREPLHVLINNAGIAGRHGVTADGFELQFGVNHLGHFALTQALLPVLGRSGQARVVTVASDSHYQVNRVNFDALRSRTRSIIGMREYAVSKLCNVLFTAELGRRLDGSDVTAYCLHPGVVASEIWRRVPWPARQIVTRGMLTIDQGAQTSLYCATSDEIGADSGKYFDKCRVTEPNKAVTPELAARLWEYSEKWTTAASG